MEYALREEKRKLLILSMFQDDYFLISLQITRKNISFFGGANLQIITNISKNDFVKLAHIYTVFLYEQTINTHETSQM